MQPKWQEEAEQRRREEAAQKQMIKAKEEQKKLEEAIANKNSVLTKEVAKSKLRNYVSEILRYVMMIPSMEGNDMPLSAINDSIDNIVADLDINPEHYKEQSIQSDKALIFEHLDENGLSNHIVVKRLKTLAW